MTRAENCDDLCLSVKGCPTRFCQIPMALRICHVLTRFGTSRIKVTSTYRLHCVYMSKRSEHMNAKHCLSLAENDSGGSKKVQFLCDLCLLLFQYHVTRPSGTALAGKLQMCRGDRPRSKPNRHQQNTACSEMNSISQWIKNQEAISNPAGRQSRYDF